MSKIEVETKRESQADKVRRLAREQATYRLVSLSVNDDETGKTRQILFAEQVRDLADCAATVDCEVDVEATPGTKT